MKIQMPSLVCGLVLLSGCVIKTTTPAASTVEARSIHTVIGVDVSSSSADQMKQSYQALLYGYAKDMKRERSTVSLYFFVNSPKIKLEDVPLSQETFNRILDEEINPGRVSEEKGTFFSPMLKVAAKEARKHKGDDVRLIILSDGAPDDSVKEVAEAADALAIQPNLKWVFVGPVKDGWRDRLINEYLSPLESLQTGGRDDASQKLVKLAKEVK